MIRLERSLHLLIIVVCASLFFASTLCGQTATGRIVGTVSDPSGALISGVLITVTTADTTLQYQVRTNELGLYQVPILPVGMYIVTADAPGFQKAKTDPEKLEINQSLRIDIKMAIGRGSDEVTVKEGITRIETTGPA